MVSLFDAYGVNQQDAENGKWFVIVPGEKPIRFKIRRFKSQKSKEVREKLEAPYRVPGKPFVIPPNVADDITKAQVAEGIIADWENVTDRDGSPLPYSPAVALRILQELPELYDEIAGMSINIENFRESKQEDIVKN